MFRKPYFLTRLSRMQNMADVANLQVVDSQVVKEPSSFTYRGPHTTIQSSAVCLSLDNMQRTATTKCIQHTELFSDLAFYQKYSSFIV